MLYACDIHSRAPRVSRAKDMFIPHPGNDYKPKILHPKRAVLYSSLALVCKGIVVLTILMIPKQAFLLPDVLADQEQEMNRLIADFRASKNLPKLASNNKLESSSQMKANDMSAFSYFSHQGPEGRGLQYWMRTVGYDYTLAGENLAVGFSDVHDVLKAWIASPTHYQNLAEQEFIENGMGFSSGEFEGRSTVFIAHHFGDPYIPVIQPSAERDQAILSPQKPQPVAITTNLRKMGKVKSEIAQEMPTAVPQPIQYDKNTSTIVWRDAQDGTILMIRAYISGPVDRVTVFVLSHRILLQKSDDDSHIYSAKLTVPEKSDDLFKPAIASSIEIIAQDGERMLDTINWEKIKVVEPTPIETYTMAKRWLPGIIGDLTNTSQKIYQGVALFFAIALVLMIFIEIKKQRWHIVGQTGLLIALLVVLSII